MAKETATQDEIDAASGETLYENNSGSISASGPGGLSAGQYELAPVVAAQSEPSGITRVRSLRASNLAILIGIIGGGAKQLLELIAGFNPSHLQALLVCLTAYGEIKGDDAAAFESRVSWAAKIFEAWARMTPGTRDDDYSNWLNRIMYDAELRKEFVGLVAHRTGDKPPADGGEKLAAAAKDAGIEAPDVLHFADTIAGVIETLSKKTG